MQVHDDGTGTLRPDPSGAPSLNGTYGMDVVCDTYPGLTIEQVTVTGSKTVIDFALTSEYTSRFRTAAPGQETAFYIADPESRSEYKLLNVQGIALEPTWGCVETGETARFTLTFERIPDTLTSFHVIEGHQSSVDADGLPTNTWTFMNVSLK